VSPMSSDVAVPDVADVADVAVTATKGGLRGVGGEREAGIRSCPAGEVDGTGGFHGDGARLIGLGPAEIRGERQLLAGRRQFQMV